jgi:hypothetical protein
LQQYVLYITTIIWKENSDQYGSRCLEIDKQKAIINCKLRNVMLASYNSLAESSNGSFKDCGIDEF